MRANRSAVFPFEEFDPVPRRDLSAVLESARRDIEAARSVHHTTPERYAFRDRLVSFLKERARSGARDPLRLYEEAIRKFTASEMV